LPQFAQDELPKLGSGQGVDTQRPVGFRRKCGAFYRILFGHHDRIGVRERDVREREIARRKPVMIREWMRLKLNTQRLEMSEKAARVSYACHRMNPLASEMFRPDYVLRIE